MTVPEVKVPTDDAGGTASSGGNGGMLEPQMVMEVLEMVAWWRYWPAGSSGGGICLAAATEVLAWHAVIIVPAKNGVEYWR